MLSLIGLVVLASIVKADATAEYGVVIDAGSSGSRVRVYTWTQRESSRDLPLDVEETFNFKVKPGLSTFEDNIEGIEDYIKELIAKAVENVPGDQQSSTPIYLLCTAGMRLLDEDKATAVMKRVDELLSDSAFSPFQFSSTNSRILSGEEEAVFAWIDVNYNLGVFSQESPQTVGLLEMGGASAQITFLPEGDPLANLFPVKLNGVDYKLYAHSYLAYGLGYSEKWLAQYLWNYKGRPSVLDFPCMFRGDNKTLVLDVMGSPEVHLIGTSDPRGCQRLVNQLVYMVRPLYCNPEPCAIGTVYQPSIPDDRPFYAVSAFVYTTSDLQAIFGNVINAEGFASPRSIQRAAWKACTWDWERAQEKSTQPPQYATDLCRAGVYFGTLLARGYNFETWDRQVKIASDVNGNEIAWTLGALLYELGQ